MEQTHPPPDTATEQWPTPWTRAALELCVLAVVTRAGSTHGYDVVRRLRDAGLGEVKGGTLYPVLTRLEEQGLLRTWWVEGSAGPGRKLVQATPLGVDALAQRRDGWVRWTRHVSDLLLASTSPDQTDQTDQQKEIVR